MELKRRRIKISNEKYKKSLRIHTRQNAVSDFKKSRNTCEVENWKKYQDPEAKEEQSNLASMIW